MDVLEVQRTPNPNALKFVVGGAFTGFHSFTKPEEAAKDPLAAAIFALGEVTSVFYTSNFLTVSKTPAGDWSALQPAVLEVLRNAS